MLNFQYPQMSSTVSTSSTPVIPEVPVYLEKLLDPELENLYHTKIQQRLFKAARTTDNFQSVFNQLKDSVPSENAVITEIGKLKQTLDTNYQAGLAYLDARRAGYQLLYQRAAAFGNKLNQWTENHADLTEGGGQFEEYEYEQDDEDHNESETENFLHRIRDKYVVEAINDDFGTPSVETFINGLNKLKDTVSLLMVENHSIETQAETIHQIKKQLKNLLNDAETMRDTIIESDDLEDYDYDEIDASMEYKSECLQKGYEEFDHICIALSAFKKNIKQQWSYLSELLEAYEETQTQIHQIENNLANAFTLLRNKISAVEKYQNESSRKSLLKKDTNLLNSSPAKLLKKIVNISLYDELNKKENAAELDQLAKKIVKQKYELIKILGDKPWQITLDNEVGVLKGFIEIVRIQKRMNELERQLAENAKQIAKPIVSSLPPDVLHSHDYAFAHINQEGVNKVFGVRQEAQKNGLDSPLARLIGSLDAQNSSIKYIGFLHLLFQPPHKMSRYEEGVLSMTNISVQTKVATYDTYKEMVEPQNTVIQTSVMPTTNTAAPFDWIVPEIPAHFNHFKPNKPYDRVLHLDHFSAEVEDIYMSLVMRLVDFFRDKEVRNRFNLPSGHPVVCLIVSSGGEILSWALNTRDADLTQHAETNALNLYFMQNPTHQYLPEGVKIFTSLKSCPMCSGGIVDCLHPAKVESVAVIYGQKELGKSNTCLQESGIERSSKLKINNTLVFEQINKTYEQLKKQESSLKGATTNAAESLYHDSQTAVLDQVTDNFIKNMSATGSVASKLQPHIRSFLDIHGLSELLLERNIIRGQKLIK